MTSLRTRILLVVVALAVVPLALLGLWLTRATARTGETLLRARLEAALDETARQVGSQWVRRRSELLSLAEDPVLRAWLAADDTVGTAQALRARLARLDPPVTGVRGRDAAGRPGPRLSTVVEGQAAATFTVRMPLYASGNGPAVGALDVEQAGRALLGATARPPAVGGMVLGLFDGDTGASLLPIPFDPALLAAEGFSWGGERWLVARRSLREPAVELRAAAPLDPFTEPLRAAAGRGTWLLLFTAAFGIAAAAVVTGRMTRSLDRLAHVADAVARGDLQPRVADPGRDEIGRVARAFNAMTDSLRSTLARLSEQEALAAVGEFAATLAHEIRNPLTAIRIDLQQLEERLPTDPQVRVLHRRALAEVERLDRTVGGALRLARSGRATLAPLDLRAPLRAAAGAAMPAFAAVGATLLPGDPPAPMRVRGDAGALEQLFLNLLLNAAHAIGAGGVAAVEVEAGDREVVVSVRDNGRGIAAEELERVFEPFYTTRQDGTGLGLVVARRIAAAHGGRLELDSVEGGGTAARVTLPLAPPV